MSDAYLVMSDGRVFTGKSFGAVGETSGEVVFNTSMTGYQEILTDPSYEGQIVNMTYPLIGNVGVNDEDVESRKPFVRGFIVKEESAITSNWRRIKSLGTYLIDNGVVGIQGIDTRALTRHIRKKGAMPGIINSKGGSIKDIKKRAARLKGLDGVDCVKRVTCEQAYQWRGGLWELGSGFAPGFDKPKFKVTAVDLGIKQSILRNFDNIGAQVTVVPASTGADEILSYDPDGVFLSNGPGDPSAVTYVIETVKKLIGVKPVFGICLGHQILSLALGARTYKLKFGHHGANHPVMDLSTKKVEITSQNHNFAVDPDSLPGDLKLTHINLNDRTVEGVKSRTLAVFSVQYHPEASPGPHDSSYLFSRFADMMIASGRKRASA
ncbi:Carbamoyl-phosphate synthase small chain [hydrothermal vent metagenome]|uniref:carbamoyl-phosphate synthase (glutamine-hydrolyzing) n=1 Tax=hydrothermal vent metagenome TaxID=652676 RepID=A0A3B1CA12_9ZZZZ